MALDANRWLNAGADWETIRATLERGMAGMLRVED